MDFLSRHEKTLKPGNLAFTLILIVAALGMNAYLYTRLGGNAVAGGNAIVRPNNNSDPNSYFFTGKSYDLVASTVAAIVATGTVVGALLAKINNDHLGGARVFETTGLFLMILVLIVCLCLMLVPREANSSAATDEEDSSYEAVILCLSSILLGMICVMTGSAKEYTVLGTSFWFMMTIIALGLTVNSYRVATNEGNDDGADVTAENNLARLYSSNEESIAVASISFLSIVAVLGFIHMFLDGKSFSKLTGVDYRIVKSPYRTASPKRRTSPRRKLTSLKPKRK